jgi:hypothetical protein
MAGVSLAFALVTALTVPLAVAIPFAIAWGIAILSLDRLFVVSLPRKGTRLNHLLRATPRVLLALLLGFVISTPFVLQIFRPEIEHEITVLHAQAQQQYLKSQAASQLQQNITADTMKVTTLTQEEGGGHTAPGRADSGPAGTTLPGRDSADPGKAAGRGRQHRLELPALRDGTRVELLRVQSRRGRSGG